MKSLRNRNIIAISTLTLIFIIGFALTMRGAAFATENNSNDAANSNKPKTMDESKFNYKTENLKGEADVKSKINFEVKEPVYKYKNMKKVKVTGKNDSSSIGALQVVVTLYKADDGAIVRVQQSKDTGKPEDLLSTCKKVSINGVDAWVIGSDNPHGNKQIMIWKDNMYYNVSSEIAPLDELVKVTGSL